MQLYIRANLKLHTMSGHIIFFIPSPPGIFVLVALLSRLLLPVAHNVQTRLVSIQNKLCFKSSL
ncbi:uncharacterized protein LOC143192536 isoform X2 [Rhynchophorus ferrugineus]|uniref:uncharacterized protein LOC143192536 isoform X2 n=1 Tax=Rhynchophorus ferrugineus TaxID=354439 RepID=UPI003FCEB025